MAIGPDALGIDIEALIDRPSERLAQQVLNPDELAQWSSLAEAERSPALTDAWTAREALLKADGGGLRWDLQRARIPSQLPGWAEIRGQQRNWWLQKLSAPPGFAACLATGEPVEPPTTYRFNWQTLQPEPT
nr:4'-phosphopantetheinyl transferase superfamily protein [Pseudomarimonas arenosa]